MRRTTGESKLNQVVAGAASGAGEMRLSFSAACLSFPMPAKTTRKKTTRKRKPPTAIIDGIEIQLAQRIHGYHKQPISVLRKIVDMAIERRNERLKNSSPRKKATT